MCGTLSLDNLVYFYFWGRAIGDSLSSGLRDALEKFVCKREKDESAKKGNWCTMWTKISIFERALQREMRDVRRKRNWSAIMCRDRKGVVVYTGTTERTGFRDKWKGRLCDKHVGGLHVYMARNCFLTGTRTKTRQ